MKSFYILAIATTLCFSCNNNTKTEASSKDVAEHTTETIQKTPKATFLTETVGLTHCESAV